MLLCRNILGDYFYLPGGHVEFGEAASMALIREFEEETGCRIVVGACALIAEGVFQAGKRVHHELNIVFHVEHPPTDVKSQEADISFQWTELSALVELDLRPEVVKAWLMSGGEVANSSIWFSEIANPPEQSES